MTFVLSAVTPWFALQVSDRLVTAGGKPLDPFANKSVLFFTVDGAVAISYTGAAFVRGLPTDHWIAQLLAGTALEHPGMRIGPPLHQVDTGHALRLIERALNAAPATVRDAPFELVAAGYQWSRRTMRYRPVLCLIGNDEGSAKFSIEHAVPRHSWRSPPWIHSAAVGTFPFTDSQFSAVGGRLGAALMNNGAASVIEAMEQEMVATVRLARSLESPGASVIGPNCLSILLQPAQARARVRYFAEPGTPGSALGSWLPGYSPWIVSTAGLVSTPSVLIGGSEVRTGVFVVALEGGPGPPGHVFMGTHDRPVLPGRGPALEAGPERPPDDIRAALGQPRKLQPGQGDLCWCGSGEQRKDCHPES